MLRSSATEYSPCENAPIKLNSADHSQTEHVHRKSSGYPRQNEDRAQLARLGKKSVLKRNFGFLTILGFSCAVLITWEGTLMSSGIGLTNGGPAGLFYGFIFVWIGNISVFSTLCELVSMAPTSGGQYHWVAMLAPRSYSRFLSYVTGWLTVGGWQGTSASAAIFTGTALQGLVHFNLPDYDPHKYQGTLMLCLCVLIAVFINTVVSSFLPKLEGIILVCHILGFFAILITLTTFGDQGGGSAFFSDFRNGGDWPTQGLSWFVGLVGSVFAFAGVDCSFHMCEEVRNPSVAVPRSIMASIVINGIMAMGIIIAMQSAVTDVDKALNSDTGYPYIEMFYQATGSVGGVTAMTALIIFMNFCAVIGVVAATSRVFWSFARDRGLPFWPFLSKVDSRTAVPVWAVATTSVISCLLGLINIGSTVAFNALVSLSVSGLYSSYLIAASLLLYRRCGKGFKLPDPSAFPALASTTAEEDQHLVWGPWRVPGTFGIVNNVFACIFMTIVLFFSFWPPIIPVTPHNMNFSVLMTGSLVLFSIVYYLVWARKVYRGPIVEV